MILVTLSNVNKTTDSTYQLLDDLSDKIVYVISRDTYELLYANKIALAAWGKGNYYLGVRCHEFINNKVKPCPWCSVPNMVNGYFKSNEIYLEEEKLWLEIECKDIDWYGKAAIAVFASDKTSQKKQENSLEFSNTELKQTINHIPVGICVYQKRENVISVVDVNEYMCNLVGMSRQAIIKEDYYKSFDHISVKHQELVSAATETAFKDGHSTVVYLHRNEKSGKYIWIRREGVVAAQDDGSKLCFFSYVDITREMESESDSKANRFKYELAVKGANLRVSEYDIKNHKIITYNDEASKDKGSHEIKNVPKSLLTAYDKNDWSKIVEMFRKIDNGEVESITAELWHDHKKSVPHCDKVTYTLFRDEQGVPQKAFGLIQDITEQKMQMVNYNRMIEDLLKTMPDTLFTYRVNLSKNKCISIYNKLNKGSSITDFDKLTAFLEKELIIDEISRKYITKNEREDLIDIFLKGKNYLNTDYQFCDECNNIRWGKLTITMARNPETDDIEAVVYSSDISYQKLTDEMNSRIIETDYDYLRLINVDNGTIVYNYVRHQAENYTPHTDDEYDKDMKIAINMITEKEDAQEIINQLSLDTIKANLEENEVYTCTFNIRHDDEETRRKQIKFYYLDATHCYVLSTGSDITDVTRKEQKNNQELQKALNDAKAADAVKSKFLRRVSHDIRTPINVITNMTEFAYDDLGDAEKLKTDLDNIKHSNKFLLSLINDILDLSNIKSETMELHPEEYPLQEYVENLHIMFDQTCKDHGIDFKLVSEIDESVILFVDKVRLNQISLNLVGNSIRYTPPGGTIIHKISILKREGNKLWISLIFKDTGIGMSEEYQKIMFEPFTLNESLTTKTLNERGTGLGLSITKEIVDMMRGTIKVTSSYGRGTTIIVEMPLIYLKNHQEKAEKEPFVKSGIVKKVLLVEDHPINASITRKLLEREGIEVDWVKNGKAAVERFSDSANNEFNVILMDIQMPIMNGYEAAKIIRDLKREDASKVVIIALTADAFKQDIELAEDAGMNGHISKPIDANSLVEQIEKICMK